MKSNFRTLGEFIELVKVKNTDNQDLELKGININKFFMPSVANIIGTDLSNYQIVSNNQFACNRMHVGRDLRLPVALLKEQTKIIVSPAYDVFRIIDEELLNPDYLMMWFTRSEFDRNCWFHTDADVRGGLPWSLFCNLMLPVPNIDKQKEIVKEYEIITNRIKLNEEFNQKLEETAQTIYKQWFVDFEFPISKEYAEQIGKPELEGKPYQSNGGEMVYNDELEQEIPVGWVIKSLKEFAKIKGGKRLPNGESLATINTNYPYIKVANMSKNKFIFLNKGFEYLTSETQQKISKYTVIENDLILSIVGTIGVTSIIDSTLNKANLTENCVKITGFNTINVDYLYHYFQSSIGQKELRMKIVGGVQGKLPIYNIESFKLYKPNNSIMDDFSLLVKKINLNILKKSEQVILLSNMKNLLLSRSAKVM